MHDHGATYVINKQPLDRFTVIHNAFIGPQRPENGRSHEPFYLYMLKNMSG